jgi:putative hydrolase of the HAD superfamily
MAAQPIHAPRTARGPDAVLLDAMGTLLTFAPPAPRLRAELAGRTGVDVGAAAAGAAIRDEIRHYRAHMHLGGTLAGLAELRASSAEAMRPALGDAVAGLAPEALEEALMAALRFVAYPDAAALLGALREDGVRVIVVSNWDASLHERLVETGLDGLVDGALASAEVGSAKPDGAIFARALELAGSGPDETWHVGDSLEADVDGALAAGLRAALLVRDGDPPAVPAGVRVVRSLAELPAVWASLDA